MLAPRQYFLKRKNFIYKPRVLIDVTLTLKSMSYLAYLASPYIPYWFGLNYCNQNRED